MSVQFHRLKDQITQSVLLLIFSNLYSTNDSLLVRGMEWKATRSVSGSRSKKDRSCGHEKHHNFISDYSKRERKRKIWDLKNGHWFLHDIIPRHAMFCLILVIHMQIRMDRSSYRKEGREITVWMPVFNSWGSSLWFMYTLSRLEQQADVVPYICQDRTPSRVDERERREIRETRIGLQMTWWWRWWCVV